LVETKLLLSIIGKYLNSEQILTMETKCFTQKTLVKSVLSVTDTVCGTNVYKLDW